MLYFVRNHLCPHSVGTSPKSQELPNPTGFHTSREFLILMTHRCYFLHHNRTLHIQVGDPTLLNFLISVDPSLTMLVLPLLLSEAIKRDQYTLPFAKRCRPFEVVAWPFHYSVSLWAILMELGTPFIGNGLDRNGVLWSLFPMKNDGMLLRFF